jgi:hypothetical protein
MVDIAQERRKWTELVGRFILSFGDIENTTFLAIAHLPTERIFDAASSLPFGELAFQQVIKSVRNQNKIITLADLEALVSEAESLSASLYELQGAISAT